MTENRKIFWAAVAVLVLLLLVGGGFIVRCVLLGGLAFFCFWLLAAKSRAVRWIVRHFPLLTDAVATIGTFFLMPPGITAWFAATVMGILTTAFVARERELHLYKRVTPCGAATTNGGGGGGGPPEEGGVGVPAR